MFWKKKNQVQDVSAEATPELEPFFPDSMLDELRKSSDNLKRTSIETCDLATDISVSLQDELFEVKKQLKEFTKIISDGLIITDDNNSIIDVSPAAEAIFGYSRKELTELHLLDLMPEIYRNDLETILKVRKEDPERTRTFNILEGAKGLTNNNKEIDIELTISEITQKGLPCYYVVVRDISGRIKREKELAKKTKIIEAINFCAQNLLRASWRDAMGESLKLLGETSNANRSFIYKFAGPEAELQGGWHSDGAKKLLHSTFHSIDWDNTACQNIYNRLQTGAVAINFETEEDMHLKALLASFGAKSISLFPIIVEDTLWGYFSFHYEEPNVWSKGEMAALETASSIFSEAITRGRKNKDINILRTAINSLSDSVVITNKDGNILFVNNAFCEYTGYKSKELDNIIYWDMLEEETFAEIKATTAASQTWEGIVSYHAKNGDILRDYLIVVPVKNGDVFTPSLYLMIKKMHIPEDTWFGTKRRSKKRS